MCRSLSLLTFLFYIDPQLSKQFLSVGEIFVQPIFDRLAGARHQIEFYKEEAHDKPRQGGECSSHRVAKD